MINPLLSLFTFAILIGLALLLIWPKKGIIARWNKSKLNTKRVLIEDALKHLYDCEYKNLNCSLNSIAGNLNISADRSTEIVAKLKSLKLVLIDNHFIKLTSEGRSYALRVIRIHRLWESYLAEETSFDELDWHERA